MPKRKGIFQEFRDFIARGNVIDLAVGVMIGAAFNKIVTSLVEGARATLKRLYRMGTEVELRPANAQHAPIRLHASKVAVQGIFRGLLRPAS